MFLNGTGSYTCSKFTCIFFRQRLIIVKEINREKSGQSRYAAPVQTKEHSAAK
jgi:hypothetical protein